jgi:hypothetical protein
MTQSSSYGWTPRPPQRLERISKSLRLTSALILGLKAGLRGSPLRIVDVGARGGCRGGGNFCGERA